MFYDLIFYNKISITNILWLKNIYIYNEYKQPEIKYLLIYVLIRKLDLLDNSKIFNCFYLFRYFFGHKAYIISYKSTYLLGKTFVDFDIGLQLKNNKIYFPLHVYTYELQPVLNLSVARDYFINNKKINIVLWDVNIFTEKKTNVGLFNLVDPLHFSIAINWSKNYKVTKIIMTSLKIKLN